MVIVELTTQKKKKKTGNRLSLTLTQLKDSVLAVFINDCVSLKAAVRYS